LEVARETNFKVLEYILKFKHPFLVAFFHQKKKPWPSLMHLASP
jgi:hypothetical protein